MLKLAEYLDIARKTARRYAGGRSRRALLQSEDAIDLMVRRMMEMESKYDGRRGMKRSVWRVYVARKAILEFVRDGSRRRRGAPGPLVDVIDPRAPEPIDAMVAEEEAEESRNVVSGLMNCLTEKQRVCVSMRYMGGMGPTEIARHAGVSQQTASGLIRRGIRRMREVSG